MTWTRFVAVEMGRNGLIFFFLMYFGARSNWICLWDVSECEEKQMNQEWILGC